MSFAEDSWLNQSTGNESTEIGYEKSGESQTVPLPHENFDPYYDSFSQADDFLTQTLTSLQDLDIPIGEPYYYDNPNSFILPKTHKKNVSGTAIFGFMGHNKTLSIPGASNVPRSITPAKLLQTNIKFSKPPPTPIPQAPIMYQVPEQLELAQRGYYSTPQQFTTLPTPNSAKTAGSRQQSPVHTPQLQPSLPIQKGRAPKYEENEDFVNTKKPPEEYKFPPSPPQQREEGKKTVEVSVEYLQKLTSLIKNTEGIDMQKFLEYDLDTFPVPFKRPSTPLQDQRGKVENFDTPKRVPTILSTAHSQPQPERYPALPVPSQHSLYHPQDQGITEQRNEEQPYQIYNQANDTQFIQTQPHLQHPHQHQRPSSQELNRNQYSSSESPVTPDRLAPDISFNSSPIKKDSNWVPEMFSDLSESSPRKKNQLHRVSTLPPGEIDQYFIGPREDKTYVCTFENCGKTFTRRYNVRSHVQTHLKDRPFPCLHPGCSKSFVRQHDLTRHKKIHEDFAFSCLCGKKFARHDALLKHRTRQICQGGIEDIGSPNKAKHNVTNGSVRKSPSKKHTFKQTVIRFENDNVAKKLENDFIKALNKKSETKQPTIPDSNNVGSLLESVKTDDSNDFLNDLNFGHF